MAAHITKFSQITNQLPYPKYIKGALSTIHADIITIVLSNPSRPISYLKNCIALVNTVSYKMLQNEEPHYKRGDELDFSEIIDDIEIRDLLTSNKIYVPFKDIHWELDNVSKVSRHELDQIVTQNAVSASSQNIEVPIRKVESAQPVKKVQYTEVSETNKEDLYIRPPAVPRFTTSDPIAAMNIDNSVYSVYKSLPLVPRTQNEISVSTDINMMTEKDLLHLFPAQLIHTRASVMYQPMDDIELHPILGLILPIEGYSRDELIANIVRYPHLYKLTKMIDGKISSFYTTIEIDGQLYKISEIWKSLPEASTIPYTTDFVKEYVVRRYILEEEVKHIKHNYPMYGTLDPFLTLFTNPHDYEELGYNDPVYLAKSCVQSRVSYKKSRNPVMRRINENV